MLNFSWKSISLASPNLLKIFGFAEYIYYICRTKPITCIHRENTGIKDELTYNYPDMKIFTRILLLGMMSLYASASFGQSESDTIILTSSDLSGLYKTKNKSYVSVHDPSVVYEPSSNYYYIFGTHVGVARTADLQSWSGVNNNIFGVVNSSGSVVSASADQAFITNQTTKVNALVNGTVQEVDFGPFDAMSWNCALPDPKTGNAWTVWGNMWAPDVIYNKKMKKWCQYLSLNGPTWNSTIILLTSSTITGPYVYQGPVVYTGFRNATDARINWKKTDLELVIGTKSSLPSRYNHEDWGNYLPHAIDPCVFYDDNGQLWMSYGSWSGGIYVLKLDESTGLRDYTVTYPIKNDANGRPTSDPYFGTQIAGGYYVSGEGSYIQKIGDYYYLFVTNGGLSAAEGYVMRVFRSKNPDGPYVDAKGKSAVYSYYSMNYGTGDAETRGNLLVTAHNNLGFQTVGQVAQGHNSAIVDGKGRAFVVYHTRFNNGGEGHQVRVRQLFTNKEGWLVAAPFEYNGETLTDDSIKSSCKFTNQEISGTYQLTEIRYKLDNANLQCVTPVEVKLLDNGTVTGAYTGTWSLEEGTGYIKLRLNSVTYSGVVLEQMYDGTTLKSVSITASSTAGTGIWAVKMQPKYAIAYNQPKVSTPITNRMTISKNLDLTSETWFGVTYDWVSSNPEVVSNTGRYNPTDETVELTMTNRLTAENYRYEAAYTVKAKADDHLEGDYTSGMLAYYDFDNLPIVNRLNESEKATLARMTNGVNPNLAEDGLMNGQVVHVQGGTQDDKKAGYLRMPNPLLDHPDLKGATISLWVKRTDDNWFGTLWAFTEKLPSIIANNSRLFITSNDYVGYTNQTDTFAINYPKTAKTDIPKDKWSHVVMTISAEDGINVYVNKLKRSKVFASTMGNVAADFDYSLVLKTLSTASYFNIGYGNGIATAEADYDDLIIYDRALSKDDVELLYSKATRVTDFASDATGIEDVMAEGGVTVMDGIYDLSGRKLDVRSASELRRGIYVVSRNGKTQKVLVK